MSHATLLDLSRWQWALTAAMHITFPAVTVGTSVFLVVCYAMYMRTDDEVWLRMFRFWRRIFGIGFALGVVSGNPQCCPGRRPGASSFTDDRRPPHATDLTPGLLSTSWRQPGA
jgi:hypothetical protein